VVLRYNWLTSYNLLIDWVQSSITFPTKYIEDPISEQKTSMQAFISEEMEPQPNSDNHDNSDSDTTDETIPTTTPKINISLVDAATYSKKQNSPGPQEFCLRLVSNDISACSSSMPDSLPVDMSNVLEEYHEFMDVFDKVKANMLAQHRPYNLKINLEGDSIPPLGQIYSISQTELKTLQEFLDDHIATGFIRPSQSLHRAPVCFAKRKDSSLRLCIDFHGLNKITKKDRYPLPLIADLPDTPGKPQIYAKIDLQHAYHLVCIAEGNEWKTAFKTRYGSFEWLVMPFGLTNTPATFQRFMNGIFSDMVDVCVVIYLDNILIYSNNIDKHHTHVQEVLRCL
jgi:hypothetical protein